MELVDYPQAILDASREYLKLESQVQDIKKEIDDLEWQISKPIYSNAELKNQSQRDYARKEALSLNSAYQNALNEYKEICGKRNEIKVNLNFLRERCSVLKISQLARLEFLSRVEVPNDIRVHLAGSALQGLFTSSAHNYLDPQDSVKKISVFVEALLSQFNEELTSSNLWSNRVSTPEFYPEEPDESEFEDELE